MPGSTLPHAPLERVDEAPLAVVEHRDEERVLAGEVAVEGLVREPGFLHDVADPGVDVAGAGHHRVGGVEQAAHLAGVALEPPRHRPLRELVLQAWERHSASGNSIPSSWSHACSSRRWGFARVLGLNAPPLHRCGGRGSVGGWARGDDALPRTAATGQVQRTLIVERLEQALRAVTPQRVAVSPKPRSLIRDEQACDHEDRI